MHILAKSLILLLSCYASNSISANLADDLQTCQKISANNKRLACYDALTTPTMIKTSSAIESVATVSASTANTVTKDAAVATKKVTVAPTPIVTTKITRPSSVPVVTATAQPHSNDDAFGKEHLKKTAAEEKNQTVIFTISQLTKMVRGQWKITFENGQRWQQTYAVKYKLKVGDVVELKKGFFNVVYLKKKNINKSIKVKRIK